MASLNKDRAFTVSADGSSTWTFCVTKTGNDTKFECAPPTDQLPFRYTLDCILIMREIITRARKTLTKEDVMEIVKESIGA